MKKANLIIYGLFGAISLAYGVLNLLFPAFLVPETGQSFVLSHILREQAAAVLFVGLMFFGASSTMNGGRPFIIS